MNAVVAVLLAFAAFTGPPAAGFLSRRHTAGVWLAVAVCLPPVCLVCGQPLAAATAVMSMILAVLAVGVSRPCPQLSWRERRREDREVRRFQRELEPLGQIDLEYAERSDPYPGDERVA